MMHENPGMKPIKIGLKDKIKVSKADEQMALASKVAALLRKEPMTAAEIGEELGMSPYGAAALLRHMRDGIHGPSKVVHMSISPYKNQGAIWSIGSLQIDESKELSEIASACIASNWIPRRAA